MAHPRLFRFGIQASRPLPGQQWSELARRTEQLGYELFAVPDHYYGQIGTVPALMAAAAATSRLIVGCTVFGVDFRNPVVLAKEMATLDLLSDGRSFVGLGAGWLRTDYEALDIPFDPPRLRIDRLEETLAIIKGLFADGPFTFEGRYYRLSGYDGQPKPVRRPRPPLYVGGGGKRILSLAAREADIVGINAPLRSGDLGGFLSSTATAGAPDQQIAWIREAAGSRFDDLELGAIAFTVMVTPDFAGATEALANRFESSPETIRTSPHVLIGDTDQIVDTLQQRRSRYGISNVIVPAAVIDDFAPIVDRLSGT